MSRTADYSNDLTPREMQVLSVLWDYEFSVQQIADALCVSSRTVSGHLANLYSKLGVSSRVGAIRKAMEMRILEPPEPHVHTVVHVCQDCGQTFPLDQSDG